MIRNFFIISLMCCSSLFGADLAHKKVIDLTYSFNEKTIYWPTARSFQHENVAWGKSEAGYWYSSANISASEHGGTHLDAPIHFSEHGWTNDQIPIDRLVGPAVV